MGTGAQEEARRIAAENKRLDRKILESRAALEAMERELTAAKVEEQTATESEADQPPEPEGGRAAEDTALQ